MENKEEFIEEMRETFKKFLENTYNTFSDEMREVFKEYLDNIDITFVIQEFMERASFEEEVFNRLIDKILNQAKDSKADKIFIKKEVITEGFQNITLERRYNSDLEAILDKMHHYWYVKNGILNDKMLERALVHLMRKHNPFINKEIVDSMKKEAEKKGYDLQHEVFDMKLENDE